MCKCPARETESGFKKKERPPARTSRPPCTVLQMSLLFTAGSMRGVSFSLSAPGKGGVGIGRATSNELPIPDKLISRHHGTFEVTALKHVVVYTDHSANGTAYTKAGSSGTARTIYRSSVVLNVGDVVSLVRALTVRRVPRCPRVAVIACGRHRRCLFYKGLEYFTL